jgi:hypothetical protein
MMDGSAVAGLKSVVAPLNFLVPMAVRPVSYNYEPPPGVPARTGEGETHQVAIRDARPLIGELSLDREGFVVLHHQTAVKNFYDEHEIASVYTRNASASSRRQRAPRASSRLTTSCAMRRCRQRAIR